MPRIDWRMAVYLVPQAGSIAVPMGLTFGVLSGMRRAHPSNPTIRKLLAIAITCSVASFISLGWIVPNTNQAFRELAFRQITQHRAEDVQSYRPLRRGLAELTIVELKQRMRTTSPRDLSGFSYYQRWALSSAPVVMVLFALALMISWPIGRFGGSIAAVSSLVAYLWLTDVSRLWVLDRMWPAVFAAWLPNTLFATFAVVMMVSSVRVKHPWNARGR